MNNEKDNHTCQNEQIAVEDATSATPGVDASRRKFAMSALAASSVLLSLSSRPVLGASFECKSPSGFQSGNLSTHGTPLYCSGLTPGYWGTHGGSPNKLRNPYPGKWPSPYDPGTWVLCSTTVTNNCCGSTSNTCGYWTGGTLFDSVFNCSGFGSIYAGKSMMQITWLGGGGDPYQLGAHFVAALLNAKLGLTPPLTVSAVIAMFNEWNSKGYFEPTAGVKWYSAQIITYLKSTMPV